MNKNYTSANRRPKRRMLVFQTYFLFLSCFYSNFTFATTCENTFDEVQFAVPGDFFPPFDNLNSIPPEGLDLNFDGITDIIPTCSCRSGAIIANGTNSNAGIFDDQLIIATGISGQQWILDDRTNVLRRSNLTTLPVATPIPEVGTTGVYVLPFAYREGDGYFATVRNMANLSVVYGPITNSCHYPDPVITNLGDFYCDSDPNILLYGEATSDFDNNVFPLTPVSEIWTIQRVENGQVYTGINFSPATLGEGTYKVRYTFDAGSDAHNSPEKTGCVRTVEQQVIVRHSISLSCRSNINIFLSPTTCEAQIIPSLLLSGSYNTLQGLSVNVLGGNENLGEIIPAEYVGQTLTGVVTDECSGAFCTTNISLFDNIAPTLTIPGDTTIACTGSWEPEVTGFATAEDCTEIDLSYTDQWIDNFCFNPSVEIRRTWRAVDVSGNTKTKIQKISINRGSDADFFFPEDREFSCEEWQADPSITDAEIDKAGIPSLVNVELCKFIYTSSDDTIMLCGNPEVSFIILRHWTVINDCTNFIYTTDAAGNDNSQIITVRDNTPPVITSQPVSVVATESTQVNGLDACSSRGLIPPPEVEDACNSYTIKIFTEIGEVEYVNGSDGAEGGFIPAPGLTLGEHQITYQATDACGNMSTQQGLITVVDELPPMMICNGQLNVTLQLNGFGLVRTIDIDEGSRDDCCLDRLAIKLESESDSLFRDTIQFFCYNGIQNVVLRATDCSENYNECIAQVSIRDIFPPQIEQTVTDVNLTCEEDLQNYYDPNFDAPTFIDNCEITVDFSLEESINDCNIGTLTRTWTATDNPDNTPAIVTQVITMEAITDYRLILPADMDVYCTEMTYNEMQVSSEGCDLLAVSLTVDTLIEPAAEACKRYIRHHQVINWCEYDGVSPATVLQRKDGPDTDTAVGDSYEVHSDGNFIYEVLLAGESMIGPSTGFYEYRQVIKVTDNIAPTVAFTPLESICLEATNLDCEAAIYYSFSTIDDCTPISQLSVDYGLALHGGAIQADSYGTLLALGSGAYAIEGNYPAGQHFFRILVSDDCGNIEPVNLSFEIDDCTPPVLDCANTMTMQLDGNGVLNLTPGLFTSMVTDNCSMVNLSFAQDMSQDTLVLGCDDRGINGINIWATDTTGNQSSCMLSLEVLDDAGACQSFWNMDGQIAKESGDGVENCTVNLSGGQVEQAITDVEGAYAFQPMAEGNAYRITPVKDDGHNNGLTTFDLIKITQHILTTQLLDSPYKIIAADANRSGGISTFDVLQIRKLILGTASVFTDNTSWRFVPNDYVFSNPANPFAEVFPEYVDIDDLSADSTINFVAIKVGDVNGSANPGLISDPEERYQGAGLLFHAEDQFVQAGEEFELTFLPEEEDVMGYQFTLNFDQESLGFLSVVPGQSLSESNLGLSQLGEGRIHLSWNRTSTTQRPAFSLRFVARDAGRLSEWIKLAPEGLPAESYWAINSEILVGELNLLFDTEHSEIFLVEQNHPNPFSTSTVVTFNLPVAETVKFEVRDLNGKLVYLEQGYFPKGRNEIVLDAKIFQKTGVFIYYLATDHFSDTKKLLFLDK